MSQCRYIQIYLFISFCVHICASSLCDNPFSYGVASGPVDNGVVLWTHVEPTCCENVSLTVANSLPGLGNTNLMIAVVDIEPTFSTVHHQIDLQPADYEYTFTCRKNNGENPNTTGNTRILSSDRETVNLLVASDNHYDGGVFRSFREMALRLEAGTADMTVHTGDFIYESYTPDTPEDDWANYFLEWGRFNGTLSAPTHRCVTISDYTLRYKQYLSDPNLLRLRKSGMFLHVPADNEVAEDYFNNGAPLYSHNPTSDGSFLDRRHAGLTVRNAFMPVKMEPASALGLTPFVSLGAAADLIALDAHSASDETRSFPDAIVTCHDPTLWEENLPSACQNITHAPDCALSMKDSDYSSKFAAAIVCFNNELIYNSKFVKLGATQVSRIRNLISSSNKPVVVLASSSSTVPFVSHPTLYDKFIRFKSILKSEAENLAEIPSLHVVVAIAYGIGFRTFNNLFNAHHEIDQIMDACTTHQKMCIFINGGFHQGTISKLGDHGFELNVPPISSPNGFTDPSYNGVNISSQVAAQATKELEVKNYLTMSRTYRTVKEALEAFPTIYLNLPEYVAGQPIVLPQKPSGRLLAVGGKGFGVANISKQSVTLTEVTIPSGCCMTDDPAVADTIEQSNAFYTGYGHYFNTHCVYTEHYFPPIAVDTNLPLNKCRNLETNYIDGCCNQK